MECFPFNISRMGLVIQHIRQTNHATTRASYGKKLFLPDDHNYDYNLQVHSTRSEINYQKLTPDYYSLLINSYNICTSLLKSSYNLIQLYRMYLIRLNHLHNGESLNFVQCAVLLS